MPLRSSALAVAAIAVLAADLAHATTVVGKDEMIASLEDEDEEAYPDVDVRADTQQMKAPRTVPTDFEDTFAGKNFVGADGDDELFHGQNFGHHEAGGNWLQKRWEDVKFDLKYNPRQAALRIVTDGLVVVILLYFCLSSISYRRHDISAWLHRRRMAAKYKRVKKSESDAELSEADEDDIGLLEVVSSSFTADRSTECTINLGDGTKAKTCPVYVSDLEKTSELAFKIADGLKLSGDAELAAVSLIDLYLADRVKMQYAPAGKPATSLVDVGKADVTTPPMLRAAVAFRVTVLPPRSR